MLDNRFRRVGTEALRYFTAFQEPCFVTPKELRSNEVVARVIDAEGSSLFVVQRNWPEIEQELKKLAAQTREKIIDRFLSITLTVFHGSNILESMPEKAHYSKEDAACEVLSSPYALYKVGRSDLYSPQEMAFELDKIFRRMYGPESDQFEFDAVLAILETNDEVVRVARFLSEQRIVPHASTMEELDDEGQAFLCSYCPPTQRVAMSWRELVGVPPNN